MTKIIGMVLAFMLVATPKTPIHAAELTSSDTSSDSMVTATVTAQLDLNSLEPATETLNSVVAGEALEPIHPLTVQDIAKAAVTAKFGKNQFAAFNAIVTRESNWNLNAVNRSSGACGLGQALPCSKLPGHSAEDQVKWMLGYIADRYGTPDAAWDFWQAHNWY